MSGGHNKIKYDDVKRIFEQNGFVLISKEYINNNHPLEAICSCGNEVKIRLSHVKTGGKCQQCKGKNNSKKLRMPENELIKFCNEKGCQFVRSWIQSKKTRIEYVCKCGNKAEAAWSNFVRFPNCKKCGSAKISGANCHFYDPDREAVAMRKRFRKMCGQHIHRFMKATGQRKTKRTHELLGYKPIDLQNHILNHPEMANCIGKEWHVDHIFPIQAFIDHNILDLKIINSLDNLRPMVGPENVLKSDTYDKKQFLEWLEIKKIHN